MGHFKQTFAVTASYLDKSEVLNLLYLSKGMQKTLLQHNPQLFTSQVFSGYTAMMHVKLINNQN